MVLPKHEHVFKEFLTNAVFSLTSNTCLQAYIQVGMQTACQLKASEKLRMSRLNSEKTSTALQVGKKREKKKRGYYDTKQKMTGPNQVG